MSVGETLRKAREAKGLSIEDVKNSTQIMTRQILEIEEDDFSSCADPFYAKHFVRTFARAVGLDPAEVVQAFLEQTAGGLGSAPKPTQKSVAAAPAVEPPANPPAAPPAEVPPAVETPAPPSAAEAPGVAEDLFSLATAPKPAPAAPEEPKPAPAAPEEPKPAVSSRNAAKVVAATPLAFERRQAQRPQPEKRVAAAEPGTRAPEPAPERGVRREGRAEFVPPPAAKKLPEPPSAAFRGTPLDGRPVAPDPLPLEGAPFRFPEEAGDLPSPASAAAATAVAAPAAPAPAPVLQSRQRKNLSPAPDEEIVAAAPSAPGPAPAAPAKDEPLFAEKRRREPRPDAPNAAALFFSNLAASARKALSRKPRRGPILAGAAALVALCVAGGVYLAAGGRGAGGSDAPGETPAPRPDESVATANPGPATTAEPPEPIAPVFPPPASWAK